MRLVRIVPQFVDYLPDRLEPGVLYISERFRTCSHLCCCGCGDEVVTPLSAAEWKLTQQGELVSLWPSVGNWDYDCQSHYVIERNQVRWARRMSTGDIARVKQCDTADLQRMIASQRPLRGSGVLLHGYWHRAKARVRAFIERLFG